MRRCRRWLWITLSEFGDFELVIWKFRIWIQFWSQTSRFQEKFARGRAEFEKQSDTALPQNGASYGIKFFSQPIFIWDLIHFQISIQILSLRSALIQPTPGDQTKEPQDPVEFQRAHSRWSMVRYQSGDRNSRDFSCSRSCTSSYLVFGLNAGQPGSEMLLLDFLIQHWSSRSSDQTIRLEFSTRTRTQFQDRGSSEDREWRV